MELNIVSACEILEINPDEISSLTPESLKKKYHKLALQHHPDKHNNSAKATAHFQNINESYVYLNHELCNSDMSRKFVFSSFYHSKHSKNQNRFDKKGREQEKEQDNCGDNCNVNDMNTTYAHILKVFITNLIHNHEYDDLIKDIVTGCKKISIKLFEHMSKDSAMDVYGFLIKHKSTLNVSDETLEEVRSALLNKYENTFIYILNPSLEDLFDSNVYKLVHNNHTYFVPLWHSELYYDCLDDGDQYSCGEIIVKCLPELPDGVVIDEYNNVHITVRKIFSEIDLDNPYINFNLGKKQFTLNREELMIKRLQYFTLRKKGIAKIDVTDTYNVDIKSDIFVKLIFT